MSNLSTVRAVHVPAAFMEPQAESRPGRGEDAPFLLTINDSSALDFIAGPNTAVISCNADRSIIAANSAALRLLGADLPTLFGARFADWVSTRDRAKLGQYFWASTKQTSPVPFECSIVASHGRVIRAEVAVLPLLDRSGTLDGYLLRFSDSEAASAPTAEAVIRLASMGTTPAAADRSLVSVEDLHVRLAGAWRASKISGDPISLLRIDVDGLHAAAAQLGCRVSAEVTSWIAEVLVEAFPRSASTPTRLAHGSFACILPGCDETAAQLRLGAIRQQLQPLLDASRAGAMLSISMSVSTAWPQKTPDADFSSLFSTAGSA